MTAQRDPRLWFMFKADGMWCFDRVSVSLSSRTTWSELSVDKRELRGFFFSVRYSVIVTTFSLPYYHYPCVFTGFYAI